MNSYRSTSRPRRTLLRLSLLLLLAAAYAPRLHAQQVAIKSNGLMWLAMMPNAGCEFTVGERSTVDASLFGSVNIYGHKAKLFGFAPEYRYWFNGRPLTRQFVGVSVAGVTYDITWGDRLYQGDAGGLGITFGHVMNLGKRLNIEFSGGFGAVYFKQKQFYTTDNMGDYAESGVTQANATGCKLLPLKLGVSVSYILK